MATPSVALAQSGTGDGIEALPAGYQVPLATPFATGVAIQGTAGYGYTEGVLDGSDHHHRASGILSVAARPLTWLAVGLRLDGRYDHSSGMQGDAEGWIGEPRFYLRGATRVLGWLGLGLQATLWLPSQSLPSIDFNAASVELQGLLAYAPEHGPIRVGLEGGYRFDRSANSVPRPGALSNAQRLMLDLSAFDAVVLGAVVSARFGMVEPFVEWRWDLLVGNGAPDAGISPMHARIGARWQPLAGRNLFAGIVLDVSPSARPSPGAPVPLVAVDPRVSAFVTLGVRLPFDSHASTSGEGTSAAQAGVVVGRVLDPEGHPIAGATARVTSGSRWFEATTDNDGRYRVEGIPLGAAELTVRAEARPDVHRAVMVRASATPHEENVAMEHALPRGQVRGEVHSFEGEAVRATIRIRELNVEQQTQPDGSFQIDVAPGHFTVVVAAPGYEEQRRPVHVEVNGVTVLNVDLRRRH